MKKLFITTAIAALFSANVFAADGTTSATSAARVSYNVATKFTADFTNATDVTWTVNKNFQKAEFTLNDAKMTAFYNHNGEFVALTQDVDKRAIPAKAQKEIADYYKGYAVKEVIVVQNNTELNPDADENAYFVDLKSDAKELLVKITPEAHIQFYKQVK